MVINRNALRIATFAASVVLVALVVVGVWHGKVAAKAADASQPVRHYRGRIPVYYWHMWSGEWQPVMNRVCDEFNASQTTYEVIPLQIPPAEGDQKFLLSVAGGDPPDVMAQWSPAMSTWAQAGVLQPMDTLMTPQERRRFLQDTYPVVHQSGWYKGHLYGLMLAFDVYACYYRPDQFRAAGLDPNHFPTTLESLTSEAAKLNVTDSSGRLTRVGFLPSGLPEYAASFGGGFYNQANATVLTNTPDNLRALQYIVDCHKQLGFDRLLRYNAGLNSQDGANWPFISGQVAITLDGEWRVKQLGQYAPNVDYKVAALPPIVGGIPDAGYSSPDYLTIPTGAKHTAGAWAFIKFWAGVDDPVQAAKYKTWFAWLPNSPQMAAAPVYQQYLKRYPQYKTFVTMAASKNIITMPPVPYSSFFQDRLTTDDDLAERGVLTPEQALKLLQSQLNQELAQRKALGYDQ